MHQKMPVKKKNVGMSLAVWIIIIVVLAVILFKEPSITGKVIQEKEEIFSENLNLQVDESGEYNWTLRNPGSIKSLKVSGSVTSNGTAKVYLEKDGERKVLFDSTRQLFDVNIHVLPEYKKVFQGDEILIENLLFNLRGFGAGNVNVRYSIKDSKGNIIAAEEEIVFIETQAKFIRTLVIPAEIKAGTYTAFVEAYTNSTILGSGSDTFEIMSKYKTPSIAELKYYLIALAAIVALVIGSFIGAYEYKKAKKKKAIVEIREKAPLAKISKLEGELKALESAYKAGFISKESYEKDKKRIEGMIGKNK
ncbi:hypothetical protein HYX05_03125 [Candidatus Woesearchaeota archaeon]|nr:hypothetical protein [Candidatus Woesearchaeota archaeon]